MGFKPCFAHPDLWIKDMGDHYKYIGTFVDDVLLFSKKPEGILEKLKTKYGYKLKNVGPPEYYNGADMLFNESTQCWEMSARTYIKNICEKIEKLFGITLKNYGSPMETGDHPEIDETDLLAPQEISQYQMLVGCAQWTVTLGRYDVQYATNTLARYGTTPREGHLKRMLRLFGYLKHHQKYRIAFDNGDPSYDSPEFFEHDFTGLYPDANEDIPENMPEPRTRGVYITVYADSSHGSCLITRRSTTGILLAVNRTPILTYCKRQNTVESSTYGSEFMAERITIKRILKYRYKC